MNYKYLDVVRMYLSEKYTTDEIVFNNLDKQIVDAINNLTADVDKATFTLSNYNFTKEEVEKLILKNQDDFIP